ncbi:uncharacterized protein LOC114794005 [Denticeps clupeoides]|uniref:uncharacterized protein LOC114794005 n=1 Tax=Denticeps clupeoides TaxID=299321 RepID=UPI0010A2D986|nr:uncharacterized protein LOC114794005 [Denticeps clupeoides]
MRRVDSDSNGLFSSGENTDNDCEDVMGASCEEASAVCLCERGPHTIYCEQHPQAGTAKCEQCGKRRVTITRLSEGYGTEEECAQSDPQGESDADADIEDTDSRLQVAGSLQRISSRKRRRQRITRQDTTESEDDGGRSHRSHRWNLRLSPHRTHSRTILEESVSQVRPLVLCRCSAGEGRPAAAAPDAGPNVRTKWLLPAWPSSFSFPLLVSLIFLPLTLSFIVVIMSFLLPLTST